MQNYVTAADPWVRVYQTNKFDPMPCMDRNRAIICLADILDQVCQLNTIHIINKNVRLGCIRNNSHGSALMPEGKLRFVLNDYSRCAVGTLPVFGT